MDRNKILEDIEEIFEICQERNIGSNETELDIRETITDYIVKKLTLTNVVSSSTIKKGNADDLEKSNRELDRDIDDKFM